MEVQMILAIQTIDNREVILEILQSLALKLYYRDVVIKTTQSWLQLDIDRNVIEAVNHK